MADNIAISAGTGTAVATDEVAGAHFQRFKLDGGGDGLSAPILATEEPPLANVAGLPTREVGQDVWSVGFSATQATLDSGFTELKLGTGMGRSQANSNLILTGGTTPNSEFLARSNASFSGALLARFRHFLSNRIVNTNYMAMLADRIGEELNYTNTTTAVTVTLPAHGFSAGNVSQSMCLGGITPTSGTAVPGRYVIGSVPDSDTIVFTVTGWAAGAGTLDLFGRHFARVHFNSTNAAGALMDVSNKGWADTQQNIATITTGSPGHMVQIHLDGRNAFFSDMALSSSTAPNVSLRGSRFELVPDDLTPLHFYIWMYNGTSAPASSITWTIGQCTVEKFANLPVYVVGQRLQGNAIPAPVAIVGTPTVASANSAGTALIGDMGVQYRSNATGACLLRNIVSAATTNASNARNTAARLLGWQFSNTSAAFKYVKLHNTNVAPTPGASVSITIALPPSSNMNYSCEGGIGFSSGIGFTIVGGSADNDTTAVAVGDVVGTLFYA